MQKPICYLTFPFKKPGFISKPVRSNGAFSLPVLLMLLLLLVYGQSQSQVVPDGTEGEVFDTLIYDPDFVPHKYANWNQFDGPLTTLKFGGGYLYDYVTYIQDDVSKEQVKLEPGFSVRDFRVIMSGHFKFKRDVTWKVGAMYDGDAEDWLIRETGVMFGVPELSGNLFIGRTKEGYSMNKIMNGYAGWSMERQMGIDVIPILADGVKWMGFLPKHRILYNVGFFVDWLSSNQGFSTYAWQTAARVGWLPVYNEAQKTLLHIALSGRYGQPEDDAIRVKSRPEVSIAPFFVDTDVFPSKSSVHMGVEAYYSTGPWMFGAEYHAHQFDSPETDNPVFYGGEIMATYIITGESRPYNTATGIYGFVPVNRPVFKGGPGAWEVMLRITNIDLDSGTLSGGKFWRITPMVNWYLSKRVRLELAYGYGVLDRFNQSGTTQFFQARIQLAIL